MQTRPNTLEKVFAAVFIGVINGFIIAVKSIRRMHRPNVGLDSLVNPHDVEASRAQLFTSWVDVRLEFGEALSVMVRPEISTS